MAIGREEPWLEVSGVFMIKGQGLVATGVLRGGGVNAGDRVVVSHGGEELTAVCRGVELINSRPGFGIDPRTIGLLLSDLTTDQIAEGDIVRFDLASRHLPPC